MCSSHSTHRTSDWSAHVRARLCLAGVRRGVVYAAPLVALLALLFQPVVTLARPSSGGGAQVSVSPESGPVGAHLTVTGEHFNANDPVEVGYTPSDCASMTTIDKATGTASGDGSVSLKVIWPNTGRGEFVVCVHDIKTGKSYPSNNPYKVLSDAPPALSVSPSPATSQQQVTVVGSNFVPAGGAVEVLWGPQATGGAARGDICTNSIGKFTSDSSGDFTLTFNAPFASNNLPITVIAVSPQGSCTGTPVLSAQANVTIKPLAAATATGSTSVPGIAAPTWPPTGIWSVVYCLVGLLLFLLLLLALLVASRNRNKSQPAVVNQPRAQGGQPGQGGARLMGATRVSVGPDGRPIASEQMYAQGRRGGSVQVADIGGAGEEMPPLQGSGGLPPTPRYGPPGH